MLRLARSTKRNKRKVVSGSRVTLPENFAYKPGLSFNPLARVTLVVGLPYLLVNRALEDNIKLAPAGEVKIIVQFGSTLSNKRGRVLSLSLKAISAYDSLTPPPLS